MQTGNGCIDKTAKAATLPCMKMSYTLLLLGAFSSVGCAHSLSRSGLSQAPAAMASAASPMRPDAGGVGYWRLGMTVAQIQEIPCPGGYLNPPVSQEGRTKDTYCKDAIRLGGKKRTLSFHFGSEGRLEKLGILFQEPLEQATNDLLAYMQDEWGNLQFSDGRPLSGENRASLQSPAVVTLYPKDLPTGSSRHHIFGSLGPSGVALWVTWNGTSIAPQHLLSENRRAEGGVVFPNPPVPLDQLPGAFRFFHFGMKYGDAVEAMRRVMETYPEVGVGYAPTFQNPVLESKHFPLTDTIQATVRFDMGANGEGLRGIQVFITEPEGEVLNEKSARAALTAQLDWMHQAFGKFSLALGAKTTEQVVADLPHMLPSDVTVTFRPGEKRFRKSQWLVAGTVERDSQGASLERTPSSKAKYLIKIVYTAPVLADTWAQKM